MTPTENSAPSVDLSAPLEGPISMLWAYQLRREHAYLLTRIDAFEDELHNEDSSAQMEQIKFDIKSATGQTKAIEDELGSFRFDIQTIRARLSSGDEQITELQEQLTKHEHQDAARYDTFANEQGKLSAQAEKIEAKLDKSFEAKLMEQQEQVKRLQSKTIELERQITELSEKQVTVVKESIEDLPRLNKSRDFGVPRLINNSNVSKKIEQRRHKAFSHANDLLQEIEEESCNVHIFQSSQRPEETPTTEFDLDAGVDTLSYARPFRRRIIPEDSMFMLPELPDKEQSCTVSDRISMAQDPVQSWEQYLHDGQKLVKSSLKRKEGEIVDKFVEGIADTVLQPALEHWLNERHWIWEHVEGFVSAHKTVGVNPEPSSTAEPSPIPQRVYRLPHRENALQTIGKELSKLVGDQDGSLQADIRAATKDGEPDGNRRSLRLAKKNENRGQVVKNNQQMPEANRKRQPRRKHNETRSQQIQAQRRTTKGTEAPLITVHAGNFTKKREVKPTIATKAQPNLIPMELGQRCDDCGIGRKTCLHQSQGSRLSETRVSLDGKTSVGCENDRPNITQKVSLQPKVAVSAVADTTEDQDMALDDITDSSLCVKVRKIQDLFPRETVKSCYTALVEKSGQYEEACGWMLDQTNLPGKSKTVKDVVLPSTPMRIDYSGKKLVKANIVPIPRHPEPYATPQHRLIGGPTSYKRKLNMPNQDMPTKRVKVAERKRGPPPTIPILPSSDSD